MSWKRKEHPTIPGYESKGDSVLAKRWLDFRINQLLDTWDPVWEYTFGSKKDICNFVIRDIKYPMRRGKPSDKHYANWFDCLCCHQITSDYWSLASETLRTLRLNKDKGVGDCEDTTILFVTLFLQHDWKAQACFGKVYRDDNLLGGHAFGIFEAEEDDKYRLYESTLDEPPEYPNEYPIVDLSKNRWEIGNIIYEADLRFDRDYYWEWEGSSMDEYLEKRFEDKERREKYEAIQSEWQIPVSPLKEAGILSALRWR